MAGSEIDDIFAGHKPPASFTPAGPSKIKSTKKSKRKRALNEEPSLPEKKPKTDRPIPETFVDKSDIPPSRKQTTLKATATSKKAGAKGGGGDDNFRDSRGTGPRRKTEEGWSVYKENELGIMDEGGDTPLCPFDCDCCEFEWRVQVHLAESLRDRIVPRKTHRAWNGLLVAVGSFEAFFAVILAMEVNK